MNLQPYLYDRVDLQHGSVDDSGEMLYAGLSQNVPDGYVSDLQSDFAYLGFTEVGKADGAFGNKTEAVVIQFQELCGLETTGVVSASTKDELVIWLSQGRRKGDSEQPEPDSANSNLLMVQPRVAHFSQGDARWADRVLGRSSSIRSQGCAITCIAMLLRFQGREVNPGILDAYLDANGGYSGNSVKWNVAGACAAPEGETLKFCQKTGSAKALKRVLKRRLKKNLPTLARVDYGRDADLTYNHFVLAVGLTEKEEVVMLDPGTRHGDGYANLGAENILEQTTRKGGYALVQLDWYE